ncbi:MAG: flagellar basal body rod protein FlgB [Planctomycetota bacterium]
MPSINDRETVLLRLMSAAALRARVLSENIANQNVPGYRRRVVSFEDEMRRQMASGRSIENLRPKIEIDGSSPATPDGNNVNLELETSGLRENWIAYEIYAAMLQSGNNLMQVAITESR